MALNNVSSGYHLLDTTSLLAVKSDSMYLNIDAHWNFQFGRFQNHFLSFKTSSCFAPEWFCAESIQNFVSSTTTLPTQTRQKQQTRSAWATLAFNSSARQLGLSSILPYKRISLIKSYLISDHRLCVSLLEPKQPSLLKKFVQNTTTSNFKFHFPRFHLIN